MSTPPTAAARRAAEAIRDKLDDESAPFQTEELIARIIDDSGLREAVEVLTIAQRWLSNCTPTAELDGPKPLPLIAALLTKLTK